MLKVLAAAIASIFVMTTGALAQTDRPDFYVGIHGELSWVQETDLEVGGTSIGDLEYDVEYAAGAALGYRPDTQGFLGQTRYELEVMYREGDFDNLSNATIAPGGFGGSIESYVVMANAYYDFNIWDRWVPYVGAGVGAAQHNFDSITINVDDDDTVLAYQGMLGIAYKLQPYEHTLIGLGYRYFGTTDPEFTTASGASLEHSYDSHNMELFLRLPF
jgi:opacity protein-like surface antigen